MDCTEIGIVETRRIVKTINDIYGLDLSEFALTSLKRRFEKIMSQNNFRDIDYLIQKLSNNTEFYPEFLSQLLVESTEMFRDPSLWRLLRDEFLPAELGKNRKYKIWFPLVVVGEELYSLLIMLKESGWLEDIEIYASYISDVCLENIKTGVFKNNKIEVSNENYKRYQGNSALTEYYRISNETFKKDTSLIESVQFIKLKEFFDPIPRDINLIMFRNQMIYYNLAMQDKVLKVLHKALSVRGHIAIGAKERIPVNSNSLFTAYNETESIYKKKLI